MNQGLIIEKEIIKHGKEEMHLYVLEIEEHQNKMELQKIIESHHIQTLFVLQSQKEELESQKQITKVLSNQNQSNQVYDLYFEIYQEKKNVGLIITRQSYKEEIYKLFYKYMITYENKKVQWINQQNYFQNISKELQQEYYELIQKNPQVPQFFETEFMNTNNLLRNDNQNEFMSHIIDQQQPQQSERNIQMVEQISYLSPPLVQSASKINNQGINHQFGQLLIDSCSQLQQQQYIQNVGESEVISEYNRFSEIEKKNNDTKSIDISELVPPSKIDEQKKFELPPPIVFQPFSKRYEIKCFK